MSDYDYKGMKAGTSIHINRDDLKRVRSAVDYHNGRGNMLFEVRRTGSGAEKSYRLHKISGAIQQRFQVVSTYPKCPKRMPARETMAFPFDELTEAGMGFALDQIDVQRARKAAQKHTDATGAKFYFGFWQGKYHCYRIYNGD